MRAIRRILILFILFKMHERRFLHQHSLHTNERRYLFFSRATTILKAWLARALIFRWCKLCKHIIIARLSTLRCRLGLVIGGLRLRGHLHFLVGVAVDVEEALRLLKAGSRWLDRTTRRVGW